MTGEIVHGQVKDLLAVIEKWCHEHLPGSAVAAAEAMAEEVGRHAAAVVFETAVGRGGHRAGYCGPRLNCACGQTARFVGYRGRWVRSLQGEVHLERAYYHCAQCREGTAPWDLAQGLSAGSFTPRVKAKVARLCARMVFREAEEELRDWSGLMLAESTLEALTLEVGTRLRAAEDARTTGWFTQGLLPPPAPLAARVAGQRAYLSVDAAKAHIDGGWHDVKVATFSRGVRGVAKEADGCLRIGSDTAQETQYLAAQETAEAFMQRTYVWALGLGAERATELIVLGDGAEWIWTWAGVHFSDATQILDYYHATEHVWELSRAVFGGESAAGSAWAQACCERLEQHGPPGLLASLQELGRVRRAGERALSSEEREAVGRELRYFRRHRKRMRYSEYRGRGLMIGSGPVEAGCKTVVGQRLKGTGMRWCNGGADAVLAIRTALLSQRPDQIMASARAA